MKLVTHKSAQDFLASAQVHLEQRPDVHHHLIQVATMVTRDSDFFEPPYGFWTVNDGPKTIGCALHVKPDGLVLSDVDGDFVDLVLNGLRQWEYVPIRIVCDPRIAAAVQRSYRNAFGTHLNDQKTWTVARLDAVVRPGSYQNGSMRIATRDDSPIVSDWARQYSNAAPSFLDVADFIAMKLAAGELYIYENVEPCSMATVSGRTRQGVRISSVFTPPEHRHRGYASAVVATLSKLLLSEGSEFVVLTWTQCAKVGRSYRKIGFYPVATRQSLIAAANAPPFDALSHSDGLP